MNTFFSNEEAAYILSIAGPIDNINFLPIYVKWQKLVLVDTCKETLYLRNSIVADFAEDF